jgi:hypothetical protein
VRIIGLHIVSEGELETESMMVFALHYGHFYAVISSFREGFEEGTFGQLFVDILCRFDKLFEIQLGELQFLDPVALTDAIERILAFVLQDCVLCQGFPVSSYAEVFRLNVLWLNGIPDNVNLRTICEKLSLVICEETAFEAEFFPILAELPTSNFHFLSMGDASWMAHEHHYEIMRTTSWEEVDKFVRPTHSQRKTMVTVFRMVQESIS